MSLFVAGMAGSAVHCVPMCSGFVLGQVADGMSRLPQAKLCEWQRMRVGLLVPYHLGRLTTYAGMGALSASSVALFVRNGWSSRLTAILLAIAAFTFFAQALGYVRPAGGLPVLGDLIVRVCRNCDRGSAAGRYVLGLTLGLLPCGFLYGALIAAAASGRPTLGGLYMLAFGLGTVPALALVGIAGQAAAHRCRRAVAAISPAVMVLNSLLLLALAWQEFSVA